MPALSIELVIVRRIDNVVKNQRQLWEFSPTPETKVDGSGTEVISEAKQHLSVSQPKVLNTGHHFLAVSIWANFSTSEPPANAHSWTCLESRFHVSLISPSQSDFRYSSLRNETKSSLCLSVQDSAIFQGLAVSMSSRIVNSYESLPFHGSSGSGVWASMYRTDKRCNRLKTVMTG
jgi:hypothetical protein